MKTHFCSSRREFLKTSFWGGLAALTAVRWSGRTWAAAERAALKPTSRVALMAGEDHVYNTFRSLKAFEREISRAIGDRRVIIKPNSVNIEVPLCATPANCLEGILEFLKSIGKAGNAIIAESAASGPTFEGFANYGYPKVADRYGVKLLDLDQQDIEIVHVFDEKDFRPHPVHMSKLLLDRNNFIISAAKMKTHDRIVTTLSLKNIVFGAPIKDPGYRGGKAGRAGAKNDKTIAHGGGYRGINYNLFALAQRLRPDLSVIDGYQGMQGNGPVRGTPVEHRVCVAGLDWLAADRTAVELMGIDFAKVGYLTYCAQTGLGEGDLKKIEIIGEPLAQHIKPYKLADSIAKQLIWMTPPEEA